MVSQKRYSEKDAMYLSFDQDKKKLGPALQRGQGIIEQVWNYNTNAWATSIHAADIDGDGDIEILVGLRNGRILALTRRKAPKWMTPVLDNGMGIVSVIGITRRSDKPQQIYILAGSHNGIIYGLNHKGEKLKEYQLNGNIRHMYVDPRYPDEILVGSDDHYVYKLDRHTLQPISTYDTGGIVRSVFAYDIDNDGENEIFAATGDHYIDVLGPDGDLKERIDSGEDKITTLFVAPLQNGKVALLGGSSNKKLLAWSLADPVSGEKRDLHFERKPLPLLEDESFEHFIRAIAVADVNHDGFNEILVVTERQCLSILDRHGRTLWKHPLERFVSSIFAADIDQDGAVEIVVGMEEHSVLLLRVEMGIASNEDGETRYEEILNIYHNLSRKESQLLHFLAGRRKQPLQYRHMEWSWIELFMAQRQYEEALSLLLPLRRQNVQHLWSVSVSCSGTITAINSGNYFKDETSELVVTTENGRLEIIDVKPSVGNVSISRNLNKDVNKLEVLTQQAPAFDHILVGLNDHILYILDHEGNVLKQFQVDNEEDVVSALYVQKHATEHKILLGMTNGNIYFYDSSLSQRLGTIKTDEEIRILCTNDREASQVFVATARNRICAYTDGGELLWQYDQIRRRVRAISALDIDNDGFSEVIVASEDCSVYVLDNRGHLKWRYLTPHHVLAVEVADVDEDGNMEILIGVADGYMYVLNKEGDLQWSYKTNDPVTAIHAQDLHREPPLAGSKVEIAIASDKHLDLLQVLKVGDIRSRRDLCWQECMKQVDFSDTRKSTLEFTRHKNIEIRVLASAKLAGMTDANYIEHIEEDLNRIKSSLEEQSLEFRQEMARMAVNLERSRGSHPKVMELVRQIFQELVSDPRREVKLTIIDKLLSLETKSLCFEFLERLSYNDDAWVRRTVIRQLDTQMEKYPEKVFEFLLSAAKADRYRQDETLSDDERDWLLQETGRSLARYFNMHQDRLFACIQDLIIQGSSLQVIQQIADFSSNRELQTFFDTLAQVMQLPDMADDQSIRVEDMLFEAVKALRAVSQRDVADSEGILQLYNELLLLLRVRTVSDIEQYQWIGDRDQIAWVSSRSQITPVFNGLLEVIESVRRYGKRQIMGERLSALIHAHDQLSKLQARIDAAESRRMQPDGIPTSAHHLTCPPEDHILAIVLRKWMEIIFDKIEGVRGKAHLHVVMRGANGWSEEQVVVALQISNQGRCPAEDVQIQLTESADIEIVGSRRVRIDEIGSDGYALAEFSLRPLTPSTRLLFQIDYTDALGSKTVPFADRLHLHSRTDQFRTIPNKYRTSAPLKLDKADQQLFFGRKKDLLVLQETLIATTGNSMVVLSGQRRSGKTSLLYRLMGKIMARGNDLVVLIDLQGLSLTNNVGQLLEGIAATIYEKSQERNLAISFVNSLNVSENPSADFERFLKEVLHALAPGKLVLLVDEFEILQERIDQGHISPNFLKYLRSLVQHQPGLSLLLAGAPKIRHLTEWYWAAFFNFAYTHMLAKLEPEEAEQLITTPVARYLTYDELAIEKIHRLTNDQPFLIQLLGRALITYCNKKRKNYVTVNDVNVVCEEVVKTQGNSFKWIWNRLSDAYMERLILLLLAQEDRGEWASFGDIYTSLEALRHQAEKKHVMQALRNLVEEEFVEKDADDSEPENVQYRIPMGIVRAWLRTIEPLEWPEQEVRFDGKGETAH